MYKIKILFKKFARTVFYVLIGIPVFLVSLIEVPFFFITHPRIFRNDLLFVFWHWSFGHSVFALDYASRLYYPHRISVISIPHPGSNEYIPLCFGHNMDAFFFRSVLPTGRGHVVNNIRFVLLRIPLLILSGLRGNFFVLERDAVYKTLSKTKSIFFIGNEKADKLEKGIDWIGYLHLFSNGFGEKPRLPKYLEERCRRAIESRYPDFFKKKMITLLLRKKGGKEDVETTVRSSGPQENYIPAVRYMTEAGYNVVGTGETRHECFEGIAGYFSLKNVGLPPQLLNIFLLTHAALFIGQHSGTYILANSCGIPVLLCDSFPYRIGTYNSEDIILFKHFRERDTNRKLSLVDVFTNHADLAYGYGFERKKINIESNTPEEILEAVKESLERIEGTLRLTEEEKKLSEMFHGIIPDGMLISRERNRPPRFILNSLREELLRI